MFLCSKLYATTVAEEGAWCWFADPRALHYESEDGSINMTYLGYIDVHGNICAMQYNHSAGTQTEVLVRSYFQPDDHNNPTFLVLPDQRVMLFYSRHTDERCFYYRVSRLPGDITTLGSEHTIVTEHNTTYPSPFWLSDDPEHFYLCWRGIKWHPTIAQLTLPDANDDVNVTWGPYQIVQSTGARPYAKYDSNGKDRIMLAYTTGHPDNENPNYLYYNYIDINSRQLCDVNGNALCNIADGSMLVDKSDRFIAANPDMMVDVSLYRDWVFQLASDKEGRPLIAMVRISANKKSHNYYLANWDGNEWQKHLICHAGGHFHQTRGLELCYSGGIAIDTDNPDDVYCSVPVDGQYGRVYEIVKYRIDGNGEVVSTTPITRNSQKNNVRPYVIKSSRNNVVTSSRNNVMKEDAGKGDLSSEPTLAWMVGDYYDWIVSSERPQGFCTSLVLSMPQLQEGNVAKPDSDSSSGHGLAVNQGVRPAKFDLAADFDFSVDVEMNDGVAVDLGNLKYCIDASTLLPEVRYKKKTYRSSNRLATSDSWQEADRGTGGQWYEPVPLTRFNLRLVYASGVLTTYINSRLDQSIPLQ